MRTQRRALVPLGRENLVNDNDFVIGRNASQSLCDFPSERISTTTAPSLSPPSRDQDIEPGSVLPSLARDLQGGKMP